MKLDRYKFQIVATNKLRLAAARAIRNYSHDDSEHNYIVSLQAPTGAGKTIIMASLIEDIYYGSTITKPDSDDEPMIIPSQPQAIFVWLSDSPALNEQSRAKIDLKADKIRLEQCVTIQEDSFDMEELEDGHIYFLNTQKLSATGRLGIRSDDRTYTIWETLDNTARNKADHLYFIIDEAHRGMQGQSASKATTIMQRFIKGSPEHGMRPMPVIIGMSATSERFTRLVDRCPNSSLDTVKIPANEVRSSGLLKDKILVTYPEDTTKYNDTAVLQAATKEWINKCQHWHQFTYDQHYRNVDPVFVIQVEKGKGKEISQTNLDHLLKTIEEVSDTKFAEYEVVHAFGSVSDITINGMTVHHIEPERIADDHRIKIVLFKEALSTGWDCPRAETMLSFCAAEDATYIAQLLGRMIRTPLGARVTVDESLNEVRMYLPFFNKEKVRDIINELKSTEGEDIPADIEDEEMGKGNYRPYSIYSKHKEKENPNQQDLFSNQTSNTSYETSNKPAFTSDGNADTPSNVGLSRDGSSSDTFPPRPSLQNTKPTTYPVGNSSTSSTPKPKEEQYEQTPLLPELDRKEILKFINEQAFLTYNVKETRINNYLTSLMDLSSLLTTWNVYRDANDEIKQEITGMIHEYAELLRQSGQYGKLKNDIMQMKLSIQMFDVFGEEIKLANSSELFITDTVIDNQASIADTKLGNHNYVNAYITRYTNEANEDVRDCQIDCILFVLNKDNLEKLYSYAKNKFYAFDDKYRKYIASKSEDVKKKYKKIIAAGDKVTKDFLSLPVMINNYTHPDGKKYYRHLYVDEETGIATIKLNNWEEPTIIEEGNRPDFVCWIRNQSRAAWALTIPYRMDNETKPMYPDFLIIRSDEQLKYVIDILEPHGPQYTDGLYKAKGMAEYAAEEERIGRIQMIREVKDAATGKKRLRRLDFSKGEVREKIRKAMTVEEFNHIFEEYGTFED